MRTYPKSLRAVPHYALRLMALASFLACQLAFSQQETVTSAQQALGWSLRADSSPDDASRIVCYQQAVLRDPGDLEYLLSLDRAYVRTGRFSEARTALAAKRGAFTGPAAANITDALASVERFWAGSEQAKGRQAEALTHYTQALRFYTQLFHLPRDPEDRLLDVGQVSEVLRLMGEAAESTGRPDLAFGYEKQWLTFSREHRDKGGVRLALYRLAESAEALGRHTFARNCRRQIIAEDRAQLALAQSDHDRRRQAGLLADLAETYYDDSQFGNALLCSRQALSFPPESPEEPEHILELYYRLLSEPQLKEMQQARQNTVALHQHMERLGRGALLVTEALSHMELKRPAKALPLLDQALGIMEELHDVRNQGAILFDLGQCRHALGQDGAAVLALEQAQAVFHQAGSVNEEQKASRMLSRIQHHANR